MFFEQTYLSLIAQCDGSEATELVSERMLHHAASGCPWLGERMCASYMAKKPKQTQFNDNVPMRKSTFWRARNLAVILVGLG